MTRGEELTALALDAMADSAWEAARYFGEQAFGSGELAKRALSASRAEMQASKMARAAARALRGEPEAAA